MMKTSLLVDQLVACTRDLRRLMSDASLGLDEQVRAYDLYDSLLEHIEKGYDLPSFQGYCEAARDFIRLYEEVHQSGRIERGYDPVALDQQLTLRRQLFEQRYQEAEEKAVEAAALHQLAKDTFALWNDAGFFARRRALKALRQKAGFPLEKNRLGNYVAKTYDLMNEAKLRAASAQQAYLQCDVSYKIRPDLYGKINGLLQKNQRTASTV